MAIAIRPERASDRDAIFALHARAFPSDAEARLVDALRDAGAARVSLVAEEEARVVGHVLFSPVRVAAPNGAEFAALGLAPMAVDPARQRAGVGGALVRAGLAACRADRHVLVFVLGHPAYYPRFGFEPAAAHGFSYAGGRAYDAAFFVAALAPGALAGRAGVVHFHAAFAAL
ncbi:MAG: GNAT family N-acetyltransferase [Proteobacteria bacterium]|nr:MAG: GNAT family N-acetyltransferase [Pseudomonadota bacterium]